MDKDLFFSLVICCYNSEKYLSETIDSIVNQTYTNWEIVAVNDGSIDRTEKIIQSYNSFISRKARYIFKYHQLFFSFYLWKKFSFF